MHERRKAARSRTFFGGVIQFRQCKAPVNCTVRNYSLAGAKVTLSETDLIPDRFDLTIAKKERAYRTRMIWRNINEAGVEFLPEQGEPVTNSVGMGKATATVRGRKVQIAQAHRATYREDLRIIMPSWASTLHIRNFLRVCQSRQGTSAHDPGLALWYAGSARLEFLRDVTLI